MPSKESPQLITSFRTWSSKLKTLFKMKAISIQLGQSSSIQWGRESIHIVSIKMMRSKLKQLTRTQFLPQGGSLQARNPLTRERNLPNQKASLVKEVTQKTALSHRRRTEGTTLMVRTQRLWFRILALEMKSTLWVGSRSIEPSRKIWKNLNLNFSLMLRSQWV